MNIPDMFMSHFMFPSELLFQLPALCEPDEFHAGAEAELSLMPMMLNFQFFMELIITSPVRYARITWKRRG